MKIILKNKLHTAAKDYEKDTEYDVTNAIYKKIPLLGEEK